MSVDTRLVGRAFIVGALLLTACSGDDDDADTTTSTARATTTTSPSTESTEPEAEPEATYTFGFLAPGEGQLAPFVPSQEQALALAIEDINAAGGVLGGPVRSIRDDEVTDDAARDQPRRLAGRGRQRHPRANRFRERQSPRAAARRRARCWVARRRPRPSPSPPATLASSVLPDGAERRCSLAGDRRPDHDARQTRTRCRPPRSPCSDATTSMGASSSASSPPTSPPAARRSTRSSIPRIESSSRRRSTPSSPRRLTVWCWCPTTRARRSSPSSSTPGTRSSRSSASTVSRSRTLPPERSPTIRRGRRDSR